MAHRPTYVLSERFDRALDWAVDLHREEGRGATGAPFVGRLLTVAGYVVEDGGTEDEVIAALFLDAFDEENQPGLRGNLEQEFGKHVLVIVETCSEPPGEGWRERKQAYLDRLADNNTGPEPLRVSLADHLVDLRALLHAHRKRHLSIRRDIGPSPAELLWLYRTLSDVYLARSPGPMADEFAVAVERLAAAAQPG